ncbi:RBBP9/YdeN family alpha/beta hydrolase [Rodentibacter pneumotropicus]|uniref:RBBP9/YdeN family alpha/beta hydrolase n=1 Tax=Rodentibacter pneumotropicus TaxID=758 RepID=UPI00109C2504|nr:alpha/beta hydrolase [Rodentibacter pneumotropicus]THA01985.1 serine hydrolase family protein [Rodentibacter pneumotropicus]THA02356.1 serine hydrolase family protein [Rodentibacter pneumotropicus]THA07915.1 serine hydrolase family protein [Rodentibacter pneumotropicus]
MKQVYITHGYTANEDQHWFPWLELELTKIGIPCQRLAMPNSHQPNSREWLNYHLQNVTLTAETILVGHSLGCIASLRLLAHTQQKIAAGIFVSGFHESVPGLSILDEFITDYDNQTPCLPKHSYVVTAQDDSIVPYEFSQRFAHYLGAEYHCLSTGGHFLDREGATEFPLLLEIIRLLA